MQQCRWAGRGFRGQLEGLIAGVLVIACSVQAGQGLSPSEVATAIRESQIGSGVASVCIRDIETDRIIVDIEGSRPMIPASNMKLLTSGCAAISLGPDFVFRTEVFARDGAIIVRGSGDPALGDPALLAALEPPMSVDGLVDRLASAIAASGVTRVDEVIIDDRVFARERVHAAWPTDQLDRWYCAPVSGLNFHTNCIDLFLSPAASDSSRSGIREGVPPTIAISPRAPWLHIDNRARTVGTGKYQVWAARAPESHEIAVHGEVGVPAQIPINVTVPDPSLLFGRLLATRLTEAGVTVAGALEDSNPVNSEAGPRAGVRLAASGDAPLEGDPLVIVTTSIEDVLRRCNVDSQNLFAEALLKRMGYEVTGEPGSWVNGAAVMRMIISDRIGADATAGLMVSDGSGMSRDNMVTAELIAAWLDAMRTPSPETDLFLASLPAPGEGTLRRRFSSRSPRNLVTAKSGSLNGVRTLSGYLTHPETGRTLAFSVLVNDLPTRHAELQARKLHEKIVLMADAWLTESERAAAQALGG